MGLRFSVAALKLHGPFAFEQVGALKGSGAFRAQTDRTRPPSTASETPRM
jgi:hypothetical protein